MADLRIAAEKKELRRRMLKRRASLGVGERRRAAALLTERILGHQWFYGSDKLLAFASYGSEIETGEVIREALRQGKRVYLPKVSETADEREKPPEMDFFRICGMEELAPGYRGIPEPTGREERYVYRPGEAGRVLMLLPGVAFDPLRNRLGYGKGFYDRYLADREELCLRTIGIGFQCQMVERIPQEREDVRPCQVICA